MTRVGPAGWLLGASVAAVGLSFLFRSKVRSEVQRARDEIFEIGPDCTVLIRGGSDGESSGVEGLEKARVYYFEPTIRRFQHEGFTEDQVVDAVFRDLFPECEWPPPEGAPFSQRTLYFVMGSWVRNVARSLS